MPISKTITLKICLVGDYGVGKTSIRRNYMGERVKRNYLATVGADFSFKEVDINGQNFHLLIWDLAGEEKFKNVRGLYFQGVFGCIVVFDLTRRTSFESIKNWISDIETSTLTEGVPLWIIANKEDLLVVEEQRVTDEEILELVSSLEKRYSGKFKINWTKASALSGTNIESTFEGLVTNILDWLPQRKENR